MITIVDEPVSRVKMAREFLQSLAADENAPQRERAFRDLVHQAHQSDNARQLIGAVYRLLADERENLPDSVDDVRMFVSSLAECLDMVPFVRADLERYLARCFMHQNRIAGLWLYLQELSRRRHH